MIALLLALGCFGDLGTVWLEGTAYDGRGEGAGTVAGVRVSSRDAALEPLDEAEGDADGRFRVRVAASQTFFLVLDADGHAPTAFTGFAGSEDLSANEGELWLYSDADVEALRAEFAGCAEDAGGIAEGEVRFSLPVSNPVDELPPVTTASVVAIDGDGVEYPACYLDDDGVSDPEAEQTGATGRFAVFGLPEGPVTVRVTADLGDGLTAKSAAIGWLPEGGVLPLYAVLVDAGG